MPVERAATARSKTFARIGAVEVTMFSFHDAHGRQPRFEKFRAVDGRLPVGISMFVIAGLSALTWAVLIASAMAARAVL